ncbi:MAG: hypothetical protein AB9856_17315 [Cellulosilyticaceae bacterium]
MSFRKNVNQYREEYNKLKQNPEYAKQKGMPGKNFFIEDGDILCNVRDDGDSRYPFGKNGFNFWAYSSGYMHCNEGLFSPFLRASEGQEPKIAFFGGLKKQEGYEVVPILSVPIMNCQGANRYSVLTRASAYYITEVENITLAVRVFVDDNNKMYFTMSAENHSNEEKQLFLSSYFNPFLKNAVMEGAENRWFRQGSVVERTKNQNLDSFLIEVYEERGRGTMVPNYGVFTRNATISLGAKITKDETTTSRNDYVGGTRSSLHTPKALYKGNLLGAKAVSTFTEVAIAADMLHVTLAPQSFARIDTIMTCCFDEEDKELAIYEVPTPKIIDEIEKKIVEQEIQKQSGMVFKLSKKLRGNIKEEVFNDFFRHLKKQVEFCAVIKGYIQLSNFSLIGVRDVYQALEALAYWEPETAREKMLEGLNFIQPDGRCPRQYSLPRFKGDVPNMDLRPFIDQGVWVISTISTYLKLTHDFKFLEELCGYYEFVDSKAHVAKVLNKESTVLQHMFEIMDYLLKNRDHEFTKCVCALYGDWNDALDGLGVSKHKDREYGTGVSVMATLQVYQNCKEMIELLKVINQEVYKDKIAYYEKSSKEIEEALLKYAIVQNGQGEKRIVHGWGDERSYLVGSYDDPDGKSRDGITSNAFWVLSGMYDKDMSIKETILNAYSRLSSKYGLKTFEPCFEKGTPGVGRIPNLPKGTAENGAAYSHASTFGVMSLFRMGESQKAWEELEKCLPFTHEKISVSPYVMPNSYGYNEEKQIDGESMQDWQTGSSNVMLKNLIRFVGGIEPMYEGIWIGPSNAMPYETVNFIIEVRRCKIVVKYSNKNRQNRTFVVNGLPKVGVFDKVMMTEKIWIENDNLEKNTEIIIEILD